MGHHRILVVDDEPNAREALACLLRDEGYDVDVAVDGRDAADRLAGPAPDLVLSDVRMPRMDGVELFDEARRLHPEVPFLLMTACDPRAQPLPPVGRLCKPIVIAELLDAVVRALDGSSGGALLDGDGPAVLLHDGVHER
jgi:CheY-like chemotaxis protein